MGSLTKRLDCLTETVTDDETILMRTDSGEFFALDGTAARAWELIDGKRGRTELLEVLASEFLVEPDRLALEVDEFLGQLKEWGLLEG